MISQYGLGDLKSFRLRELLTELLQRKNLLNSGVSHKTLIKKTSFEDVHLDREEEENIMIRKTFMRKSLKKNTS